MQVECSRITGFERFRCRQLGMRAANAIAVGSDQGAQLGVALVAQSNAFGKVAGEVETARVGTLEMTEQRHSQCGQGPVVKVVTVVVSARLRIARHTGLRARELGQRGLEKTGVDQPADRVATIDAARNPRRATAGEEHVTAGRMDLLGQLAAGLTTADNENFAGSKARRAGIAFGVDDLDGEGQRRGPGRPIGPLIRSGRKHHRTGLEDTRRGLERKPRGAIEGIKGVDLDAGPDRRSETGRVLLEEGDQAGLGHVAIRIRPVVQASG
jgi:hypothetical protein